MKWLQVNDYHWRRECGRYYVERALVFATNPLGSWIHLAWFKCHKDADAECISPNGRDSLQAAIGDCSWHLKQSQKLQPGGCERGSEHVVQESCDLSTADE